MKQRIEHQRALSDVGECALLSEVSLAEDWNKSEEDEAWQNFHQEILDLRFPLTYLDGRQ